ncbi:hypothetical protein [Anaeromicrobium sediminis]|nr:hypothetical protein [Anaeromicrobium sediminis]
MEKSFMMANIAMGIMIFFLLGKLLGLNVIFAISFLIGILYNLRRIKG